MMIAWLFDAASHPVFLRTMFTQSPSPIPKEVG